MEIQDDRTESQRLTHTKIVGGYDRFLSGWGKATNGSSYAFWACRTEHAERVLAWVESRKDIEGVSVRDASWRKSGNGHTHIYVVDDGHPALQ